MASLYVRYSVYLRVCHAAPRPPATPAFENCEFSVWEREDGNAGCGPA